MPVHGNGQYHAVHVRGPGHGPPRTALSLASIFDIRRQAREAGRQIMSLIRKGMRPAEILTEEAFEKAIKVHATISGSTNALIHLPAIANELGIEIDAGPFDRINREVPYLANVQPSGEYLSEFFWYAWASPESRLK